MYQEFFGLQESAFSIAVNPRYLYMSEQHREALAHLLFGIQNGGFVLLTGEVGTGKTTLVRCLMEQLPENTDMAMVLNPMASAPELLTIICEDFGISFVEDNLSVKSLTDVLHIFLVRNHAKGRKTLLLIDEAQLLQTPALEQIRLLTNLETNSEKLLQIILVGQPELKELLATPELRQLSQRITARFHLTELTLSDTQAYLQHRLQVAGMKEGENPFPEEIVKLIHQHSNGIPRLINVIAERLLLGAYAKQTKIVDKEIFDQGLREVTGELKRKPFDKSSKAIMQGVAVALVILVLVWVNNLTKPDLPVSAVTPSSLAVESSAASSEDIDSLYTSSAPAATSTSNVTVSNSISSVMNFFQQYSDLLLKKTLAESLLMNLAGEKNFDLNKPCAAQLGQNHRCQKEQFTTWDQLHELNRPGLLTLVDETKQATYLLVTGLNENHLLIRSGQQEKIVPWKDVAVHWNGEFTFVWAFPAGFDLDLAEGDQSSVVSWVADQFAKIDQQDDPLTQLVFTENLKKRLVIFQSNMGLPVTGKIDKPSIQKLNMVRGIDQSLTRLPNQNINSSRSGG